MPDIKPKIIVIAGPTASGKSAAAIKLAQKLGGEIISADSRQIFRGMDVGTGKVTREPATNDLQQTTNSKKYYVSEGIVHHLLDVVDPMEDFNVSHFKEVAEEKIVEILKRGKLPIICGGTGFWIQAVVNDVVLPKVAPNEKLRKELDKEGAAELFSRLRKIDPVRAGAIDSKNKFRLIRALEICAAIGKVPAVAASAQETTNPKYDFLQIGIDVPREILNEKIRRRLDERFAEGMIKEVQNLHKRGVSWQWLENTGLEYRWIARFLQNEVSEKEMKEKLYFDIIHYAKRQMTWLRRDKRIVWLKDYPAIEKTVEAFLA